MTETDRAPNSIPPRIAISIQTWHKYAPQCRSDDLQRVAHLRLIFSLLSMPLDQRRPGGRYEWRPTAAILRATAPSSAETAVFRRIARELDRLCAVLRPENSPQGVSCLATPRTAAVMDTGAHSRIL